MQKRIKETENTYRIIQSEEVQKVCLATNFNVKTRETEYAIDINLGEHGILTGLFKDQVRANEVLEEVRTYLASDSEEEYILPTE